MAATVDCYTSAAPVAPIIILLLLLPLLFTAINITWHIKVVQLVYGSGSLPLHACLVVEPFNLTCLDSSWCTGPSSCCCHSHHHGTKIWMPSGPIVATRLHNVQICNLYLVTAKKRLHQIRHLLVCRRRRANLKH